MNHLWVDMKYDREMECWVVVLGEQEYALHCGECFEILLGDKRSLPCRLELALDWYVIIENVKLNLRTQDTYKIKI